MEREKKMEMTENMQLTEEQNIMKLVELLRKNNMKEAANSIFEMAAYVDVMEKKMDSVLHAMDSCTFWRIFSSFFLIPRNSDTLFKAAFPFCFTAVTISLSLKWQRMLM